MQTSLTLCVLLIVPSILGMGWENEFDTYNVEECGRRVRRNWNSLTDDEQQLYIDGIIELRARGFNGLSSNETDEYALIADVHRTQFGGLVHKTSMFFFWHSYVLWEMESRIRNLGGKWACFAMPYWDFWSTDRTLEEEHGYMFQKSMGGNGDGDDWWTVTEDWPWTTEQFWVPYHCNADGDVAPLCSFKRAIGHWTQVNWAETGRIFTENPMIIDMQEKFVNYQGKTRMVIELFADSDDLQNPTTSSYDPIWYLFHSMITYQQYMWQDCNDYDQIDPEELDGVNHAYSEFLTQDKQDLIDIGVNPDMGLDTQMYFDNSLQLAKWAFINQDTLTVRKLYHLHRWNVIYDLEDGSGFYEESGFKKYCDDKLNPYWFMLTADPDHDDKHDEVNEVSDFASGHMVHSVNSFSAETTFGAMVFLVAGFAAIALLRRCGSSLRGSSLLKKRSFPDGDAIYGAIKPLEF